MLGLLGSRSIERIEHEQDLLMAMLRKVEGEKNQGLARKAFSTYLIAVKEEGEGRKGEWIVENTSHENYSTSSTSATLRHCWLG